MCIRDRDIGNPTADDYDASDVGKGVDAVEPIEFEAYAKRLEPYTFEYVSELSGVPAADLEELARVFAEPGTKIKMCIRDRCAGARPRGGWVRRRSLRSL